MSLRLDWPYFKVADSKAQFEAFRFSGVTDSNTDRGRVYVDGAADGAAVYSNRARTTLVAQAAGETPASDGSNRITLTGQGSSGLNGSVLFLSGEVTSTIVLYLALAGHEEIREYDDRIEGFLEEDPEETDFQVVLNQVSRRFYSLMQERYPPPVRAADSLRFPGTAPLQEAGTHGLPEIAATNLWLLNTEGDWELVGLENPGDYREWAVYEALARIWRRKARSGEDPVMTRANDYQALADRLFDAVPVEVDFEGDSLPDRAVKRRSRVWRRA